MKRWAVAVLWIVCSLPVHAQFPKSGFYDAIRADDSITINNPITEAGVSATDSRGTTPLMYAAAVGSFETVKALIEAGADVNARNAFDITALMLCAADQMKLELLIAHGADVNARSKQGRTALLIAAGTQGSQAIVKTLLEHGADLAKADADAGTTPLTAAAAANDAATVRLLLEHGAKVSKPAGGIALLDASGHGNVELMRLLLARGVPADVPTPPVLAKPVKNGNIAIGSLTPLMFAVSYGGAEAVQLLLEQKANVNAQDVRGMTPLMLAIAVDHPDLGVIRLLLEHGADLKIKSKDGETALDWARKFRHPDVLSSLHANPLLEGATTKLLPVSVTPGKTAEAVYRSTRLLQHTTATFFMEGGCASCHSHNLASMALSAVQGASLDVDRAALKTAAEQARTYWSAQEYTLMQRIDAPGGHNMTSYGLMQFAAEEVDPNSTTDAMVHNLAAQQSVNGNWHDFGMARPPMSDGDFTHTAIAIRALGVYGIPARRQEFMARIAKAADWLRNAKPVTAEDCNMQLLGLRWAGVQEQELVSFARKIISQQRADGGWGQTPYLNSDAYATGQTLAALKEAGIPVNSSAYRRGAEFLLRTQFPDGSWHVTSRAPKFQPYFQSGFPYQHDQWISMSGTAWATMALAYTLPKTGVNNSLAANPLLHDER